MSKRKTPGSAEHVGSPGRNPKTNNPGNKMMDGPTASTGPSLVPVPLAAPKPMARALRVTLFEREIRERLSAAALDIVFARAELLSEGQRVVRGGPPGDKHAVDNETSLPKNDPPDLPDGLKHDPRNGYAGSTMFTIDLASLTDVLRDACDAGTAHHLAELMRTDGTLPGRIRDVAEREATRVAAAKLKDLRTQISVRAQGAKVFIDVDVEAGL